jgi:hypothetical protein
MSFPTLSKNSIALVLSWLAVPALAATGGLVGTVTGPGDTGLPGVTVTVQGEEAGADRTVITGEGGSFRVSNLDTGDYTVNGSLHGFHPASLEVAVREGETARIRLSLCHTERNDSIKTRTPSFPVILRTLYMFIS